MKSIFHREVMYRGKDFMERMQNIHITLCGVGALGSNLLDNLVRQGYNRLRVIDMDRVEDHNISTQIYNRSHVGALKAQACKNIVFQTTGVEIEAEHKELNANNIKKLLKRTDLVVDMFDNSQSRKLVTEFCKNNKLSCLHGGLAADGYSQVIWNDDYVAPIDVVDNEVAPCDQPLARTAIMLTTITMLETINEFVANKTKKRADITLKDLSIRWKVS